VRQWSGEAIEETFKRGAEMDIVKHACTVRNYSDFYSYIFNSPVSGYYIDGAPRNLITEFIKIK